MALWIGCLGFVCFLCYDWNQVHNNRAIFRPLFMIGSLILLGAAGWMIWNPGWGELQIPAGLRAGSAFFAVLNLILLIYTLFFAVPFQDAYVAGSKQPICKTGIYALCRHPGVLFLFGTWLFAGTALVNVQVVAAAFVYSACNLIYVILQDRWFFPKLFAGYEQYREEVPFLIPTVVSFRQCLRDLGKGTEL